MNKMINERSQFERRHLFYCDLLGFRKYTQSEFFEPARCLQLFRKLDEMVAQATIEIDPSIPDQRSGVPPDYVVTPEAIYSFDSIAISTPATNVDAIWLCEAAARIQNHICCHGFLVRGSIVTGDLYHSGNTIFGPAIARAVELDESGTPPMIVVSDETLKSFTYATSDEDKEIVSIRERQLIARESSLLYIDPFWLTKIHANQESIGLRTRINIECWRTLIETGLRNKNVEIHEKYLWTGKRFNKCLCNKVSAIRRIALQDGENENATGSIK